MDSELIRIFIPILAIGMVISCGGFLLFRYAIRRDVNARKILFEAPHERRLRSVDDFPGLNQRKYDELRKEMEDAGFTFLGDVEDMTAANIHISPHSAARYMLSSDGVVVATIQEMRLSFFIRLLLAARGVRTLFIVAMQVRFTNGNLYVLIRCDPNTFTGEPPLIITDIIDPARSVADMVRTVGEFMNSHPELAPSPVRNLDEALECERYIDKLRRDYRLEVGLLTVTDLVKEGLSPEEAQSQVTRFEKHLVGDPVWDPALRRK